MKIIELINVSKSFNGIVALENINMTFENGKIYGLVGRNGSGKTVLIKCISGFMKPTKGKIIIDKNYSYSDFGILIERPGFLSNYNGFDNLKMLAMIRKKIDNNEIKKIMTLVGLDYKSRKKVGEYSLGMKQRLGIAQAIMENQKIIILDEPTNGLDNVSVKKIRSILLNLKDEGKVIILSSHYKEDINFLCDEIIKLDEGKIIEYTKNNKDINE